MNLINALTYIIIKLLLSLFFTCFFEFYVDILVRAVAHSISEPSDFNAFLTATSHFYIIDINFKDPLTKHYFTITKFICALILLLACSLMDL
jgi:hypothetical protein